MYTQWYMKTNNKFLYPVVYAISHHETLPRRTETDSIVFYTDKISLPSKCPNPIKRVRQPTVHSEFNSNKSSCYTVISTAELTKIIIRKYTGILSHSHWDTSLVAVLDHSFAVLDHSCATVNL
jgi:HD superfamily phosphohydrolase YqeK